MNREQPVHRLEVYRRLFLRVAENSIIKAAHAA